MNGDIHRLYPPPAERLPLAGRYLNHDIRAASLPFVYTNFITSLDGRIAQADPVTGRRQVPPAIANDRDWRLYMELAAQADVVVTTGRHLRAVAGGRHGELLEVGDGAYADLGRWRREADLPPKPVVAAVSETLDIPAEALRQRYPGKLLAITGRAAAPARIRRLRSDGIEVIQAGEGPVLTGSDVIDVLVESGFRCIYSIAGPRVLHTLLDADAVDRLYLTLAHVALGGEARDTLTRGPFPFRPPRGFRLHELHFDPEAPTDAGQLFLSLDRSRHYR